ncbi:hypothetical protein F5Y09DRAFT_310049 [Xylaria sp. FL1042]|nr:hypothetical protein F5Y09DRAFT_310049 [Xylaria sp. FL1042]
MASDRYVVLSPEGSFDTSLSYYTAFGEQYLALIADRQLYTEYPIDIYLVYRFLKDNAVQLVQQDTEAWTPSEDILMGSGSRDQMVVRPTVGKRDSQSRRS